MVQQAQRKRKRAVLETVQEDDGNSKFARALGSVDNQTREKGLQALTLWLSKKEDLTEQDLKRLWKGIFYCFWHADKAPFQVWQHALGCFEQCLELSDCFVRATGGLGSETGWHTTVPFTKGKHGCRP